MALFKYAGTSTELATKEQHDGFVYATVDYIDEEDPSQGFQEVAQWWVDINGERYRVAAASLIDAEGNIFEIDDFVRTSDTIDIEHGGTGAESAAAARENLEVYSQTESDDRYYQKSETYTVDEVDTALDTLSTAIDNKLDEQIPTSYQLSLNVVDWSGEVDAQGFYTYTTPANYVLKCGDGTVPPEITLNDPVGKTVDELQEMRDAWSKIDHAHVEPSTLNEETGEWSRTSIVFYATENMQELNVKIDLIVVDHR